MKKFLLLSMALPMLLLSACEKEDDDDNNDCDRPCGTILNEPFNQFDDVNCKPLGFSSDFTLDCKKYTNGPGYFHVTNENDWNGGYWTGVFDHTNEPLSGFILGDAATSDKRIWYRQVSVEQDEEYEFSAWLMNSNANGKYLGVTASFQFHVDGQSFHATGALAERDVWTKYTGTFIANKTGQAEIAIVVLGGRSGGNDFAIDDIKLMKINCEPEYPE